MEEFSMSDPKEIKVQVSEAELAVVNSGPAILTNRFYVTIAPYGVRIAFTERTSKEQIPAFRTAVVMSIQDGISLYKLLQNQLREAEASIEKAKAEAQSKKDNG
jgi:hypothetical protein